MEESMMDLNELNNQKLTEKEFNDKLEIQIDSNDNQQNKSIDLNLNMESNELINLNEQSTNDYLLLKDSNKWILKLNLDFRDKLIKLLSDYTKSLISNKAIFINKKELIGIKNDLIKLLTQSPLKLDKQSIFGKFVICLDNKIKYEIIDLLTMNENFIIDSKDPIDLDIKNKLIEDNNNFIIKLVNLPVEFIDINDLNLVDGDEELENDDESESDEEFELDVLESEDDELYNLKNDLISLKEEFNKLKYQLDERNTITLNLVKKDMLNFFDKNNLFSSEPITFLNINWSISIRSIFFVSRKERYLGIYLNVDNQIDDKNNVKWECKTSYELILKNNLPDKSDKIEKLDYTFDRSTGHGKVKFCQEAELFYLNNGFMKNDSICIEIKLKIHELNKNI